MAELYRFAAFISYSSKDARFAQKLHRALEHYGVPASLGQFDLTGGGKKNRIFPVFRDREELPSGDLGEAIQAALKASNALIIICSPHAAASPWVNKEIESFLALGRRNRIFAIIHPDAPLVDDQGRDGTALSFPPAFRGEGLDGGLEPIAADARRGKDGFRNAWLKVVAGLVGVNAGALQDRDARRRRVRRWQVGSGVSVAILAAALLGAGLDALFRRTDLTQRADGIVREGHPAKATALALGGAVAPGSLLSWRDDAADEVVRRTGAARILADIGPIGDLEISTNGATLFVHREDAPRSAVAFDLKTGAKTELGPLGPVLRFKISANGAVAAIHRDDAERTMAALNLKTGARTDMGPFGPLRNFVLSETGGTLALYRSPVPTTAAAINIATRAVTELGVIETFRPTEDGRTILLKRGDAQQSWAVLDLTTGGITELGAIGQTENFTISENGQMLAFQRTYADETVTLINLKTAARTELALGDIGSYFFSDDGSALVFRRDDGADTWAVHNFATGRVTEFGAHPPSLRSYQISANGETFVLNREDATSTSAVIDVKTGAKTELGPIDQFEISEDGATIIIQRNDPQKTGAVFDLKSKRTTELGALGQMRRFYLAANDKTLVLDRGGGQRIAIDLSRPVDVSRRGTGLAHSVCEANAFALQPFAPAYRDADMLQANKAVTDADRKTHSILRGRPWNPCDWRGIAAVYPNPETGDAWFEGPRQWLRLMAVRWGWAKDYACADSTFGATERVKADRANMCSRYGPKHRTTE